MIQGTDSAQIADCLGLDSSKFIHRALQSGDGENRQVVNTLAEEEKYKDVEKITITCKNISCKKSFSVDPKPQANILLCPFCLNQQSLEYISNVIDLFARKFINKYYQQFLICEEQSCQNRTRFLFFKKDSPKCTIPGCKGSLHLEVCYFSYFLNS